jgi:hypothetical protein
VPWPAPGPCEAKAAPTDVKTAPTKDKATLTEAKAAMPNTAAPTNGFPQCDLLKGAIATSAEVERSLSGRCAASLRPFRNVTRWNFCAQSGTDRVLIAFCSPARLFSSHSRRSFQSGLRRGDAVGHQT